LCMHVFFFSSNRRHESVWTHDRTSLFSILCCVCDDSDRGALRRTLLVVSRGVYTRSNMHAGRITTSTPRHDPREPRVLHVAAVDGGVFVAPV
jgi:hypothetical protein